MTLTVFQTRALTIDVDTDDDEKAKKYVKSAFIDNIEMAVDCGIEIKKAEENENIDIVLDRYGQLEIF